MRKQEKKWRIFFDAASEIFNKFSSNWNFININWNFNIRLELVSEIFVFYFTNFTLNFHLFFEYFEIMKNSDQYTCCI